MAHKQYGTIGVIGVGLFVLALIGLHILDSDLSTVDEYVSVYALATTAGSAERLTWQWGWESSLLPLDCGSRLNTLSYGPEEGVQPTGIPSHSGSKLFRVFASPRISRTTPTNSTDPPIANAQADPATSHISS